MTTELVAGSIIGLIFLFAISAYIFRATLKETAVVGRLLILADTVDVSLDIVQSVIWLNNGNVHAVVLMLSSIIAYVTSRGFDYHLAQRYDLTNNDSWGNGNPDVRSANGNPMTDAEIATSWRVQLKGARKVYYIHGWIFEASALSLAFYFSAEAGTSFSDQSGLAQINVVSTFVQLAVVFLNWLRNCGSNIGTTLDAREGNRDEGNGQYYMCYYFLIVVSCMALTVGFFVHQSVNPNVDPTFGIAHPDDFKLALWIIWGVNSYAVFWYSKHIFFWDGGVYDDRKECADDCCCCSGCFIGASRVTMNKKGPGYRKHYDRVEHRVCSWHSECDRCGLQ